VQFGFNWDPQKRSSAGHVLTLDAGRVLLVVKRNPRARRYVLRLNKQGQAQVTIPRSGSATEAFRFVDRNKSWLERQFQRFATLPKRPVEWMVGSKVLFRGELMSIEPGLDENHGAVRLSSEVIKVSDLQANLRPAIERYLWALAAKELPPKVMDFAAKHQLSVGRITVRNQKSRWGSCSRRRTISLNWRLIQAPPLVVDYIILHELTHLLHMNHSIRFWREVHRVCPDYQSAERWLKQNSTLLQPT
jgi:predicted metal-dependent hydrolase